LTLLPLAPAAACALAFFPPSLARCLARALWKTQVLGDGGARRKIEALAARAGVPVREILVAGGAAGARPNARLLGMTARSRCLVLTSWLVERAPEGVLLAAVAHELGHARRHHHLHGLWAAAAMVAASWLVPEIVSAKLGALAGWLSLPPLLLSLAALLGWIWRRFEHRADREAAAILGARLYDAGLFEGLRETSAAVRGSWFHPPLGRRRARLLIT